VRPAGPTLFVDLDVAVSRTLPLDRVTTIKDRIVTAVRGEFPTAETTVNSEPRALDDETVLERVMVIARNRALAIHHVTVQAIAGRLSVSLDLEVDGSLAFSRAHEIADGLEQAVRDELGVEVEVETHVEPLQTRGLFGRDAANERIQAVQDELSSIAQKLGVVRDVHDVRVRETPDGEIVNFHAYVDPLLSVSEVHDRIDDLERGLRLRFPTIKRVIGHAEPRRG
jgi:divalent metal cation (Fe/Co/Zn/Cd) transporter